MTSKLTIIGGGFVALVVIAGGINALSAPSDGANAADLLKQDMLRSPASFSSVSSDTVWSGKTNKGNQARIVKVVFDAQNGFGALIRDCQYVAFWYEGSKYFRFPNSATASCNLFPDEKSTIDSLVSLNFQR
jgi:hypothetical protein